MSGIFKKQNSRKKTPAGYSKNNSETKKSYAADKKAINKRIALYGKKQRKREYNREMKMKVIEELKDKSIGEVYELHNEEISRGTLECWKSRFVTSVLRITRSNSKS